VCVRVCTCECVHMCVCECVCKGGRGNECASVHVSLLHARMGDIKRVHDTDVRVSV